MRLIDADAMKEELLWGNVYLSDNETNALVDLIDNQPTIDPESLRPHGKWVKEPFSSRCVCTNCKSVFPEWIRVYNYCPLCGARMMEEEAAKFIQTFGEMMKNETKVD